MDHQLVTLLPYKRSNVIGDIEVLRGVSIILVLIAHLQFVLPLTNAWYTYVQGLSFGIGVDLFFIISGFVISRSLARELVHNDSSAAMLRGFWIRRIFRLWPAALVTILATLIAVSLLGDTESFKPYGPLGNYWMSAAGAAANFMNVVGYMTISSGGHGNMLFHFWSLSLEEQFYLAFPIAMVLLANNRNLLMFAALVVCALSMTNRESFFEFFWWFRIDGLFWGVLIHCIASEERIKVRASQAVTKLGNVGSLLILGLAVALMIGLPSSPLGFTGKLASGAVLVAVAALDTDRFQQWGALSRAVHYLGGRSYTIYLWHILFFVLLQLIWLELAPSWLNMSSGWMALLVLASATIFLPLIELLYRGIELPTRRIGRELATRSKSHRTASLAV